MSGRVIRAPEEETEFDHTPLDGVQIVLEPTRGKLKRKRRSKASIVPSEDVSNTPPTAKRLTSTSDVFISPTPYHTEPVVTLNAWGSVPTLDKRSDSAADVHQSSDSDEELSPELSRLLLPKTIWSIRMRLSQMVQKFLDHRIMFLFQRLNILSASRLLVLAE